MLNAKITSWKNIINDGPPKYNVPVIILIEHDVVENSDEEFPFLRKAILRSTHNKWQLLDYNSKTEEEYLHQWFTVVAWRYL